jgi:hypothetical protein
LLGTQKLYKCLSLSLQILSKYNKIQQNLCVCCYCGKTGKYKNAPSPLAVSAKIEGK